MDAYDLPRLTEFRASLRAVPRGAQTSLIPLTPIPERAPRVALLSGSFNPPTSAHALLADRAIADGFFVVFVLPCAPAGKAPAGFCAEDRLLALDAIRRPQSALALSSHGLYAEQAEAAAKLFNASEIAFLAGSDKLIQIFDDIWYHDRAASLDSFFSKARLMVSPRGDTVEQIQALLNDPRNAPYAPCIEVLPLHPAVGDLSSTRVRGLLASGSDSAGLVPPPVRELCNETRVYAPPDPDTGASAYELRMRALDLLWGMGEQRRDALRRLAREAREPGPRGAKLRMLLERGDPAVLQAL
ncbi:MAG: hypothetical protein NVSMB57_06110 [Actinomycetota bacterium]